jgi:Ca2+-binding EF-hand superfamily protein
MTDPKAATTTAAPGAEKRRAKPTSSNNQRLQNELTDEQRQDLAEAFNLLDAEGGHTINAKDLKVALRALGYEPQKDKVKKIISEIDKDTMSNTLTRDEFERIMKSKLFEYENMEEIEIAFPLFTEGKSDFITLDDLRRVAKDLGENLSDEVFQEMIREADVNHRGVISKEDFIRVMKRENAF